MEVLLISSRSQNQKQWRWIIIHPILEEHQYDAAAIDVGINDLLKSRTNIRVGEITKEIINI